MPTKTIDVTKPETYPYGLFESVQDLISTIPEERLRTIKNTQIDCENDAFCAIEDYLGCSSQYWFYKKELIPLFSQYNIICYHATRVGDIESIHRKGICSSFYDYLNQLESFLTQQDVTKDEIAAVLDTIKKKYAQKYAIANHSICFFTNPISFHTEDRLAGFDQYCETIGGELAYDALLGANPKVLSLLQSTGVPIVIQFRTPFSAVLDHQKYGIIYHFVAYAAVKQIWGYDLTIEPDGAIVGDVKPEDILDIIVLDEG